MSTKKTLKEEALHYHAKGRPGKIEVVPTKETATQRDLTLAYSPGVADPCLAIAETPEDVYKYTAKGNLVAVISNGTAVLGLGDIGPLASKPVMEGKGLLFKIYADIYVFDIELDTSASAPRFRRCAPGGAHGPARARHAPTHRASAPAAARARGAPGGRFLRAIQIGRAHV